MQKGKGKGQPVFFEERLPTEGIRGTTAGKLWEVTTAGLAAFFAAGFLGAGAALGKDSMSGSSEETSSAEKPESTGSAGGPLPGPNRLRRCDLHRSRHTAMKNRLQSIRGRRRSFSATHATTLTSTTRDKIFLKNLSSNSRRINRQWEGGRPIRCHSLG